MSWDGKRRLRACERVIWQCTLRAEAQRAAAAHGLTFEEVWSELQTLLALSIPDHLAALEQLKDSMTTEEYHRLKSGLSKP
jgi:hypothetical protein